MTAPHARHKLIRKRLTTNYSHLSVPTDHNSSAFKLCPWPAHTVLPGHKQPSVPPRQTERQQASRPSLLYVLGQIDREDDYNYTPKVVLELFGGDRHYRIKLDPRLVQSFEAMPRPLRPLHHVSGPRPLTPPPGPISLQPSQVVLDARQLIERANNSQLERQNLFLKRVRQAPAVLPDLWHTPSSEDCSATFKATCVGHTLPGPPVEVSTLLLSLEQARRNMKNSNLKRAPKVLGTLANEVREKRLRGKRHRPDADHLVLVTSPLSPHTSHPDIISLCTLRQSIHKLKQKSKHK